MHVGRHGRQHLEEALQDRGNRAEEMAFNIADAREKLDRGRAVALFLARALLGSREGKPPVLPRSLGVEHPQNPVGSSSNSATKGTPMVVAVVGWAGGLV